MEINHLFQLAETLFEISFYLLPYMVYVFPCIIIYINLMKFITERPVITGINLNKENVRFEKKI